MALMTSTIARFTVMPDRTAGTDAFGSFNKLEAAENLARILTAKGIPARVVTIWDARSGTSVEAHLQSNIGDTAWRMQVDRQAAKTGRTAPEAPQPKYDPYGQPRFYAGEKVVVAKRFYSPTAGSWLYDLTGEHGNPYTGVAEADIQDVPAEPVRTTYTRIEEGDVVAVEIRGGQMYPAIKRLPKSTEWVKVTKVERVKRANATTVHLYVGATRIRWDAPHTAITKRG